MEKWAQFFVKLRPGFIKGSVLILGPEKGVYKNVSK